MIVNYFEPAFNFELKPEEAINYFTGKGLKPTYNWYEMLNAQHDVSFTVAKMMDLDLLSTVQQSLKDALAKGKTFQNFKAELTPILQQKGWWGKAVDPATGASVQLGSASRLETIFRTNMQSSYAAGQWQQIVEQQEYAPYLMYDAVDDSRTRADHKAFDGEVFPISHAFWETNYPPNGWNCRCGVIQMDADDLEVYGLKVSNAPIQMKKWTNPNTGVTNKIPLGVDPGFAHNPGIATLQKLQELQKKKIDKMDAPNKAVAKKGVKATQTKAQQKKAAQDKIQAEKAALAAVEKAKAIQAAKDELAKIAAGNATKQPGLKKKLFDKYSKNGTAVDLSDDLPTLVKLIETEAAKQQAKAEVSSAISGYKKKVLAGKLPTAKQQKVFDNLDDAQKAKVIADIDKAKAAEKPAAKASTITGEDTDALNMANMKQIGGQGGSNPGGVYYDETTGKKWYIKTPKSDDHARNEVLAARLYEAAGIPVPNVVYIPGKPPRVASEIIDGLERSPQALKSGSVANIGDGFAIDAWLANWDVVGLDFDNMLVKRGTAIRLDTGGALIYRAQGGNKGSAFGDKVTELETLLDASINPQAASVFSKLSQKEIAESVGRLAKITDQQIDDLVERYWPRNTTIAGTLKKRRDYIVKQFPDLTEAAQKAKAKAIKVAREKVGQDIEQLDSDILTAIKGIAMQQSKGEPIRQKDIERVATAQRSIDKLLKNPLLTRKSRTTIVNHYQSWMDELTEATQKGKPLSGGTFGGLNKKIDIDESKVTYTIPDPNKKQIMTNGEATKVLKDYLGASVAKMNVPNEGPQDAFEELTMAHKRAISAYTGSHYQAINERLYTRAKLTKAEKGYVELLNEALEAADSYEGLSSRGVGISGSDLKRWLDDHEYAMLTGQAVKYLNFQSSTKGAKPAFNHNLTIKFKGKNGVWVNPISLHAGRENEVLFRAGSTFKVTKVDRDRLIIYVTEVDEVVKDERLEFTE